MFKQRHQHTAAAFYEKAQPIIRHAIFRFKNHYGGNDEDWQSEANAIFCTHWRLYDPTRGMSRESHLRMLLDRLLVSYVRSKLQKLKGFKQAPLEDVHAEEVVQHFDLDAFAEKYDLSDNAIEAVRVITSPPRKLRRLLRAAPTRLKSITRQFIKEHLGWDHKTLKEVYDEISVCLSV